MTLLSIQTGRPQEMKWEGATFQTGIFKSPVRGSVIVKKLNIEGDEQADLRVHGGEDKAVYAYSHDLYPHWTQWLGKPLSYGAMGENLTFELLDETQYGV